MTIVVWDGHTLASDSLALYGYIKTTEKKIYKTYINFPLDESLKPCFETHKSVKEYVRRQALIGFSGTTVLGLEMLEWAINGFDKDKFPKKAEDPSVPISFLLIVQNYLEPKYLVYRFENSHIPIVPEVPIALGSGKEVAYGALYSGASSQMAVRAAIDLVEGCGGAIKTLTFEDSYDY